MLSLDLNALLTPLAWLFGTVALASGIFLVIRSFLRFRYQVNQSLNMDLEVVQVSRKKKEEGQNQTAEAWKEEILAMEQLLGSLSLLKPRAPFLKKLFFAPPTVIFEIANPSTSEEIFFYLSVPKVYRESIEKQIHSFFPQAVIERVKEYTIFSPGNFTALSLLSLKDSHALPLRTYKELGVDPLNEISNALSKLETADEGAAIQIVLSAAGAGWRGKGKKIAERPSARYFALCIRGERECSTERPTMPYRVVIGGSAGRP